MKNPLTKRIPREFKADLGKYAVIFLFMTMLVSMLSGFLVADNSMYQAYLESFEKYNTEDGHITFDNELPEELRRNIEKKAEITLYDLKYFEEESDSRGKKSRVYILRDTVNTECLMKGRMPEKDNEILIDRMYADNNKLSIGDSITLNNKKLVISGFAAFPDYSCLYENNTDMIFDAINFNVGVMTENGWNMINSSHVSFNYAWKYNTPVSWDDKISSKEKSDLVIEALKDAVSDYDTDIALNQKSEEKIIKVTDYVPTYINNAVIFTGSDMSSDKAMFILFDYIVTIILAFIFAVTTSNTISREATVIGTLRASGYSKKELTLHYLFLPVLVTVMAGIVGNILGYTVFKDIIAGLYYNSYSLPTYVVLWNAEAFFDTTIIPLILMFVINFLLISSKLKLSPLKFLRRDLKKNNSKKAFPLSSKLPFASRFRLRVLFQNMPGYIVMITGIILGAFIFLFGEIFGTVFSDYKKDICDSIICDYQYILTEPQETENTNAEKYCMTSFDFTYRDYVKDSVSVYGIENESRYIKADIHDGTTAVSSTISKKYKIDIGDKITLSDPYSKNSSYEFTVNSIYDYDASLAVFIDRDIFNITFGKDDDYFTGYFSNEKLDDIAKDSVASMITEKDYTKVSDQMEHSLGDMLSMFKYFGIVMFLLIMYILSKQVIEKNFQSISMCKILGFKNGEIGMLYILSTSIAVIIGLAASIPLSDAIMRWTFNSYLYKIVSGYLPYKVRTSGFVYIIILGIASYSIVALLQLLKIRKVSKSEALKNAE